MLQGTLITETHVNQKTIKWSGIVATFTNHDDVTYDVELTINGISFFCAYTIGEGGILSFEILSVRGVVKLTRKLIILLKETVLHLSYRI